MPFAHSLYDCSRLYNIFAKLCGRDKSLIRNERSIVELLDEQQPRITMQMLVCLSASASASAA